MSTSKPTRATVDIWRGRGTEPTGPAGGDLSGSYPNPTLVPSPAFVAPTASTAAPGTATTQLATTAFVAAAMSGGGLTAAAVAARVAVRA